MAETIRIGLIGAGKNTQERHIPGLKNIDGVVIAGVVNRSMESSQAVAEKFGIEKCFASPQELIESPDIDAVLIGTWPDQHCALTCAALKAGKHVLTEARMARDLAEARQMLEAAKTHSELVAQVVPSPFGLVCGPSVSSMVKSHFLGDLREVVVLGANDQFWDYSKPLSPRQDSNLSGKNFLALGILHETLMRWVPEPVQVFAQTELFEPTRPSTDSGEFVTATVPDSAQILAELKGGARCMYHLSGVILFGPGLQIHLYGSRGTMKIEFVNGEEVVWHGRAGDEELQRLEIPEEELGRWQVEEDFVAAIRGKRKVDLTDFETGVKYMEFVEAVSMSAESNQPVELPLD
ncbi:Gfo/Idh/MocA family oxidoreductase [Thalassoglobus sp. JC818]|uniref:Gfo/Idh/MocA family protein n=1 Tax=Thalassoglobus sp. JC818 TaxID=3232136 RepID=UPI00345A5935